MRYIALEGPIRHGKSTLAEMLQEVAPQSIHLETSQVITEVANAFQENIEEPKHYSDIEGLNEWLNPLPGILKNVVHTDTKIEALNFSTADIHEHPRAFEKLFDYARMVEEKPELLKQNIDASNKTQFRGLLQWLGAYLSLRVDDEMWFNELVRRSQSEDEKRSADEKLEFSILGAVRMPGDERVIRRIGGHIVRIIRPGLIEQDATDLTESSRNLIRPDSTVHNDGDISDLRLVADLLINDLRNNALRGLYFAAPNA